MIPKSTRIPLSAGETMVKFLMSLTVSYPNYPIEILKNKYFPKVMVVFNGFSKYQIESTNTKKKTATHKK